MSLRQNENNCLGGSQLFLLKTAERRHPQAITERKLYSMVSTVPISIAQVQYEVPQLF